MVRDGWHIWFESVVGDWLGEERIGEQRLKLHQMLRVSKRTGRVDKREMGLDRLAVLTVQEAVVLETAATE